VSLHGVIKIYSSFHLPRISKTFAAPTRNLPVVMNVFHTWHVPKVGAQSSATPLQLRRRKVWSKTIISKRYELDYNTVHCYLKLFGIS